MKQLKMKLEQLFVFEINNFLVSIRKYEGDFQLNR